MICSKCKVKLEPINYAFYGEEKIKFKIFSILDMFKMGKDLLKKYGTKIDLDVLRSEYQDFFWNCILNFKIAGLSCDMLLKYNKLYKVKIEEEKKEEIDNKKGKAGKNIAYQR